MIRKYHVNQPSVAYIYNEGASPCLDMRLLARYLKKRTGIRVELMKTTDMPAIPGMAKEFAMAKIVDLNTNITNIEPLSVEIRYEEECCCDPKKISGVFYDGFYLQEIYRRLLPKDKNRLEYIHVIFTSRLFGTFEDNRYHARVAVYGVPSVISTTGIVVAPAKPREFYLKKQLGINESVLDKEYSDKVVGYGDLRMTEIMKGYLMQAFFYHVFGNPFCDDPNCRLYNAHWHEEVIKAQITSSYEFCQMHEEALSNLLSTRQKT
jgi:hypothetical protein